MGKGLVMNYLLHTGGGGYRPGKFYGLNDEAQKIFADFEWAMKCVSE